MVIIQSLGAEGDIPTGRIIADYIEPKIAESGLDIPIEVIDCKSPEEFFEIIKGLTVKALVGDYPLLHVDCHGDYDAGLSFSNGDDLAWEAVASVLAQLNVATSFNLLVLFSACFGYYFTETMGITKPAPCWCLVAPCSVIKQDEILNNLRVFYSELFFSKNVGRSIRNLENNKLIHGAWVCSLTEELFEKLTEAYLMKYCSKEEGRLRLDMYMSKTNNVIPRKAMKQHFKRLNNDMLFEYFERYFIMDAIPDNRVRFNHARVRLATLIKKLKSTKQYYL